MNTAIKGIKIPFHVNFEEVNLRFYVRCNDGGEWKRGVVFVKEIVPKPALTFVANTVYGEHYETMPMKHRWDVSADRITVEYQWKKRVWNTFRIDADATVQSILPGSEEEFITEHYWGYTKLTDNRTSEYGVEHPRWSTYPVHDYHIDVDFGSVYGNEFDFLRNEKPVSVLLAEGSPIQVLSGRVVKNI